MFRDLSNGGARAYHVAPSETPSLANVIDLIMADNKLPLQRRRNIASALRLMAKAAGGAPGEIPANITALRSRTAGFHPEHARISRKRWQNAWSEAAFALKHLGLTGPGTPLWVPLRRDWQRLLDSMGEAGLKNWQLGRLARYCSSRGIVPEEASDDTLSLYRQTFAASLAPIIVGGHRLPRLYRGSDRTPGRAAERSESARRASATIPTACFARRPDSGTRRGGWSRDGLSVVR